MKLLVTGGCGFIGSNFIDKCFDKWPNVQILNIDLMTTGSNPKNLINLKNQRYQFIRGNICNTKLMNKLTKDVDLIVNFAAESHVDRSITDSMRFIKTNIVGVQTILEIMRKRKNLKLIQISTDEVFGEILKGSFKEFDALNPSNPYSATKASAEMLIRSYVRTYDLNVVITRCVNNYGPRQFPEKLIPKTIIHGLQNQKIPIHGTGKAIRQWIHVYDHCDSIMKIIQKSNKPGTYNIPGKDEYTNLNIVKKILKILQKPTKLIEYVEDRPGQDRRYAISSNHMKNSINQNKINFNEGLESTVKWYIENESWWKKLPLKKITNPTPWSN